MKKMVLFAAALAMVSGSAFAADMPVKAVKAPPPAPFDPWDIAFGSAIMNDYIFRGVTQSNHNPSVAAYFEPRYNVNKDLQLYIGTSFESISFPNRAAAEIDIYGGIRPTFGAFAFDFGRLGLSVSGRNLLQCRGVPGFAASRVRQLNCVLNGNLPAATATSPRGTPASSKSTASSTTPSTTTGGRLQRVLLAELPEPRRLGRLRIDHRQVHRAEHDLRHQRRRHVCLRRIRPSVARNVGFVLWRRQPASATSRPAFLSPATTPGTSASASPTRCSRWTCVTPTPTCRRATATPSPAISPPPELQPELHHPDQSGRRSAPTGAARPASSSSRPT